jgi:hypothetical protein
MFRAQSPDLSRLVLGGDLALLRAIETALAQAGRRSAAKSRNATQRTGGSRSCALTCVRPPSAPTVDSWRPRSSTADRQVRRTSVFYLWLRDFSPDERPLPTKSALTFDSCRLRSCTVRWLSQRSSSATTHQENVRLSSGSIGCDATSPDGCRRCASAIRIRSTDLGSSHKVRAGCGKSVTPGSVLEATGNRRPSRRQLNHA